MDIFAFAKDLKRALTKKPIPQNIKNEKDFEQRFVVRVAKHIAKNDKQILLFIHPWGSKTKCHPDCKTASLGTGNRQLGCPLCWRESKSWASIAAFGTKHTFDMIVRDKQGQTLAVEIKMVRVHNGRMPNGELQRMFGQCIIAASKHDVVIGICGFSGNLNSNFEQDTAKFRKWTEGLNIFTIFRKI